VLWKTPTPRRVAARPYHELNDWSAGVPVRMLEVGLAEDYRSQK